MKRALSILLGAMLLFFFITCERGNAGTMPPQHGLTLSESDSGRVEIYEQSQSSEETSMQISVQASVGTVVFELNTSRAAKELYEQLPLTIAVENHGRIEKVFKPPARLNTSDTPLANARIGTFAYFEPWNNVVMFYGNFGSYSGLYELGHVISGGEHIENLSGTIQIDRMETR